MSNVSKAVFLRFRSINWKFIDGHSTFKFYPDLLIKLMSKYHGVGYVQMWQCWWPKAFVNNNQVVFCVSFVLLLNVHPRQMDCSCCFASLDGDFGVRVSLILCQ